MTFPAHGRSPSAIMEDLRAHKTHDLPWQKGRVFAFIYDAGPEAMGLLKEAYSFFLTENGLDPTSFPSTLELEKDVISMALDLVRGGPEARGSFTSGGTESILLSVKTARDYFRAIRPEITRPELLLPETAHAAFFKACKYFDVTPVTVPVDPERFTAIPSKMEEAITSNTIMLVGSAPSYAHGVIDPIRALGAIAQKHQLLMHVDCCIGGMYLPFARDLGFETPDFDLSVPGVTQLSMDFHKWGYAAKGASCILYKDGALRKHQIFACATWSGYSVVNPTVLSSKSAGPVAACWAILNHLGREGYLERVKATQAATKTMLEAIEAMEGVVVLGQPATNMFCFRGLDLDIFALADDLKALGWYVQPQFGYSSSPASLHISVGYNNVPHVAAFLEDLKSAVAKRREAARKGDMPPQALPAFVAALFENPGPELFDQLAGLIGSDGSSLPEHLAETNNLMNLLPPAAREMLLTEFINRLYSKSP